MLEEGYGGQWEYNILAQFEYHGGRRENSCKVVWLCLEAEFPVQNHKVNKDLSLSLSTAYFKDCF